MLTSNNKTRLMQGFSITILSMGLLASFPAAAEKYYKWVDDAGSTHYTQTPPPKAYIKKSTLVDIIATPPSSTPVVPAIPLQNQPNNTTNNVTDNNGKPEGPAVQFTPAPSETPTDSNSNR